MAKGTLLTNFVDDILNASMNGKRRYNLIPNEDGTYSLEDVTTYDQIGTDFGASILNAITTAVNESADKNKILESLAEINAVTESGYMADALAVRELNNSFSKQIDISSKITFEQPEKLITINSIKAWTKGNICVVSISLTTDNSWELGSNGTFDIVVNGLPTPLISAIWHIGLVVGTDFVGVMKGNGNTVRLRNMGNGAISKFSNYNVVFQYPI